MDAEKRKVSPRAPTLNLEEAIQRVERMYRAERRHSTPVEIALKHIGYSGKNGAALQAVASLRYWGLVERPKDGMLVVTQAFENYIYAPDDTHKQILLVNFLKTPPLFSELLEKYRNGLPSDASLQYDLIQRGFIPPSAANCVAVLKKSIEFSKFFEIKSDHDSSENEVPSIFRLPSDEFYAASFS